MSPAQLYDLTEANHRILDLLQPLVNDLPNIHHILSYLSKRVRDVSTNPDYHFNFNENVWLSINEKQSQGCMFAVMVLPLFYDKIKQSASFDYTWDTIPEELKRLVEIVDAMQKGYIDYMLMWAHKREDELDLLTYANWTKEFYDLPRQIRSPIDNGKQHDPNAWWNYFAELADLLETHNVHWYSVEWGFH